ncbi:TPA: ATP-binding protein [Legionella pneumophila]|nr:ATP-binding protein [Legionella pneumophila]
MTENIFEFSNSILIGRVYAVDTSRVMIDVEDSALLTRIGIGNLLAIKGTTEQEFLIAIVERVTRSLQDNHLDISSDSEDEIDLITAPQDSLRSVMIGTFRTVEGERKNTFKRGADSFPQIDRECYVIEGANLQRFMGLLGSGLCEDEQLKLGHFAADRSAGAVASGDKFFQRHAAILGSTGSGKSWAVALLLERAAKLKFPNIIVFDMHGEYKQLCEGSDRIAKGFRIAGPGDLSKVDDDVLFLPYWLLNHDEMLSMILDRSDQNAPNQASRFTLHVKTLKESTLKSEQKGDIEKTFTVDSPIPYKLSDLLDKLIEDNTKKGQGKNGPIKGEWEDKLTRFISRLEAKLEDRRYGFMFQPPKEALAYDWLANQLIKLLCSSTPDGIKIIDFSEVPTDILPVVTGTLARLLYDVQFWIPSDQRTPVSLLCDEAHLYLPTKDDADTVQKQALGSFERIAKEGRKYGFSIVVVSQRPSDVSRTILSQCNNFLTLRLTNETDQSVIKRLVPDSLSGLTDYLPLLETGEAILLGDAVLLPSRIKLDMPKITPNSATRDFWKEWGSSEPNKDALKLAIESLRSQTRLERGKE